MISASRCLRVLTLTDSVTEIARLLTIQNVNNTNRMEVQLSRSGAPMQAFQANLSIQLIIASAVAVMKNLCIHDCL